MNYLQVIARRIIKIAFNFSVVAIEYFSDMEPYQDKVAELRKLEKGTLGKEIADSLDNYNLTLVPKYESHDLKHVLLNYPMTAEGEIRMQAFMIGNGNYSIPSFAIFIFGAVLLPDLWRTFYVDFKKGRNSISVSTWTIEKYANYNLIKLKSEILKTQPISKRILSTKGIIKLGACISIVLGVFGMIYCLPFLFSSHLPDLVGAGFPFLAGAILAVGGLLTLSNLVKPNKKTSLPNVVSSL